MALAAKDGGVINALAEVLRQAKLQYLKTARTRFLSTPPTYSGVLKKGTLYVAYTLDYSNLSSIILTQRHRIDVKNIRSEI